MNIISEITSKVDWKKQYTSIHLIENICAFVDEDKILGLLFFYRKIYYYYMTVLKRLLYTGRKNYLLISKLYIIIKINITSGITSKVDWKKDYTSVHLIENICVFVDEDKILGLFFHHKSEKFIIIIYDCIKKIVIYR